VLSSNRNQTDILIPLSVLRAFFFGFLAWSFAFGFDRAFAQNEIATDLLDRPPVAAPTAKIETGAIPVVLSESQEVDNYAAGLMQGLMVGNRVTGVALVVVRDDHVMLQRAFGPIAPDTRFATGTLSQMFGAVAVMQQVERGRLMLEADISKALGETSARGMTLAQVLTFQAGDPALLERAAEKASGMVWPDYFAKEIAQPLGMTATRFRDAELETDLADMSHFATALVNGGAFQNGRILTPATVEQMESTHYTLHPVLPGAAYGFTEMRRNGWRALQHDGVTDDFVSRLVVVPDAKLSYFIVARGRAGPEFWRTLDNGLFDKLLPARNGDASASSPGGPVPTQADAQAVAGRYESIRTKLANVAPLKLGGRLTVRAGEAAALILTGSESATLIPRPGGYWASADNNLVAVPVTGELVLSTGPYGRLSLYKRPQLYLLLALLALLTGAGLLVFQRRVRPLRLVPRDPVLGFAGAGAVFLIVSAFVWLLTPGA
jgi:CubicO group peptidase (beta-lactamase class C family)